VARPIIVGVSDDQTYIGFGVKAGRQTSKASERLTTFEAS
jgi:hypothetical protein